MSASSSITSRFLARRLSRLFSPLSSTSSSFSALSLLRRSPHLDAASAPSRSFNFVPSLWYSSQSSDPVLGPAPIDYGSILPEGEFHKLADRTIQDLQEKLEEFGDKVQIDGFDIDYGNQVLTLKLGSSGTYVINKQTPNRQIWLSSPVSGPSRFDWDKTSQAWVYRRTRVNLLQLLEDELIELCGKPINLM